MTLLDAVKSFGPKITENYRETRFCDFAPPDETVGVIDVSASGNGSRGIAFLIDSMIVKLDGAARRIDYRDIRVMETLPSYETPFEDELLIASPAGDMTYLGLFDEQVFPAAAHQQYEPYQPENDRFRPRSAQRGADLRRTRSLCGAVIFRA